MFVRGRSRQFCLIGEQGQPKKVFSTILTALRIRKRLEDRVFVDRLHASADNGWWYGGGVLVVLLEQVFAVFFWG
jgi:hypothetical protein